MHVCINTNKAKFSLKIKLNKMARIEMKLATQMLKDRREIVMIHFQNIYNILLMNYFDNQFI